MGGEHDGTRGEPPTAKDVFIEAAELAPGAREAFLAERCAGRPELLAAVRGLLGALSEADHVLATGAGMITPTIAVRILPDLEPGARLGPYRIVKVAGTGGFGTVYLAEQTEPVARRVALKLLRSGLESDPARVRFEAERQALARMEHPGIARVFDAGTTDDGRPYFAMEYLRGMPITEYCARRGLGLAARLELVHAVCEAVHHAHQKGVVHRDLKPSNVMVTEVDGKPHPKVIDFGIAKAIESPLTELSMITLDGQFLGTPAYMSPEQAAGEADVDTRADVYALGALLYELLAGVPPFDVRAEPLPSLLRRIAEVEPARPSQRLAEGRGQGVSDVPPDLDWITMRCLEKERMRRYSSANALALDIDRFLRGLAVEAAPPSTWYKLRKLARRHRLAVGAAVLLFLALVAGTVGTGLGLVRANDANERLSRALERVSEEAEHARLAELARAAEAKRATEQFEVAEAINDFVTDDLLASAAPSSEPGRGRSVTLREVLDVAALRIEDSVRRGGRFADKPLVEAGIRDMLGSVYAELAEYESAIHHLRRAVQLRTLEQGEAHPATLRSLSILGSQLRATGSLQEAEELLLAVLATQAATLGESDASTLTTRWRYGQLLYRQGRLQEAYDAFDAALPVADDKLGSYAPTTLAILSGQAMAAASLGNNTRAEELFRESLRRRRRIYGEEDPDTLAAVVNYATFMRLFARYDEAESLLRDSHAKLVEIMGAGHPTTLTALFNLGAVISERGAFADAEACLRTAEEGFQAHFGELHADTLRCLAALGRCREGLGDREGAEELYRRALAGTRVVLGQEHGDTNSRRKDLAGLLFHKPGAEQEVLELLEEDYDVQRRTYGAEHPITLKAVGNLALQYNQLGDRERAEALFRESFEGLLHHYGPDHVEVLRAESDLAGFLLDVERNEEAVELGAHAVEAGERLLAPDAYDLARYRLRLGLGLERLGEPDEARRLYELAHESLLRTRGPNDVMTAFASQALTDLSSSNRGGP